MVMPFGISKGGGVSGYEPIGVELLRAYEDCCHHFQDCGWCVFCERLQGHDLQVIKVFATNFDGQEAMVGTLTFLVTEDTIVAATGLPQVRESWFKGFSIKLDQCNRFLIKDHQDPSWSKGISRIQIKHENHDLFQLVQKYIRCEGHFALTFLYHIIFLLHFYYDQKLNFPFFLQKSLTKMDLKVKGKAQIAETNLFHHGLIKLLVMQELGKIQRSREHFLFGEGFSTTPSLVEKDRGEKTRAEYSKRSSTIHKRRNKPILGGSSNESDLTPKK